MFTEKLKSKSSPYQDHNKQECNKVRTAQDWNYYQDQPTKENHTYGLKICESEYTQLKSHRKIKLYTNV